MNKIDCFSEKISSKMVGFIVLPIALLLALAGNILLPVFGLFFAVPLLLLSGVLIIAPESDACRLVNRKQSDISYGQSTK
jgi:hypothetical protein